MRLKNGHRISLGDFIIDAIGNTPGVPEDIDIRVLEATTEQIIDEVRSHIEYNLPDVTEEVLR